MKREWRFLVVEDDENKRTQLRQFLSYEYRGCAIYEAQSLMSGLRAIAEGDSPDVVLLDMTIPNFDPSPDESGGSTHGFGGREFLIELDRAGSMVPVIVVTQFKSFGKAPNEVSVSDLHEELASAYSPPYCGFVSYDPAIHGWQEKLKNLIDGVLGK